LIIIYRYWFRQKLFSSLEYFAQVMGQHIDSNSLRVSFVNQITLELLKVRNNLEALLGIRACRGVA
jgi:hypothetical protein